MPLRKLIYLLNRRRQEPYYFFTAGAVSQCGFSYALMCEFF
jgi:hypothetical protein